MNLEAFQNLLNRAPKVNLGTTESHYRDRPNRIFKQQGETDFFQPFINQLGKTVLLEETDNGGLLSEMLTPIKFKKVDLLNLRPRIRNIHRFLESTKFKNIPDLY